MSEPNVTIDGLGPTFTLPVHEALGEMAVELLMHGSNLSTEEARMRKAIKSKRAITPPASRDLLPMNDMRRYAVDFALRWAALSGNNTLSTDEIMRCAARFFVYMQSGTISE